MAFIIFDSYLIQIFRKILHKNNDLLIKKKVTLNSDIVINFNVKCDTSIFKNNYS